MPKYSLILSPNISSSTKIPVFEPCVDGLSLFERFIGSIEEKKQMEMI